METEVYVVRLFIFPGFTYACLVLILISENAGPSTALSWIHTSFQEESKNQVSLGEDCFVKFPSSLLRPITKAALFLFGELSQVGLMEPDTRSIFLFFWEGGSVPFLLGYSAYCLGKNVWTLVRTLNQGQLFDSAFASTAPTSSWVLRLVFFSQETAGLCRSAPVKIWAPPKS